MGSSLPVGQWVTQIQNPILSPIFQSIPLLVPIVAGWIFQKWNLRRNMWCKSSKSSNKTEGKLKSEYCSPELSCFKLQCPAFLPCPIQSLDMSFPNKGVTLSEEADHWGRPWSIWQLEAVCVLNSPHWVWKPLHQVIWEAHLYVYHMVAVEEELGWDYERKAYLPKQLQNIAAWSWLNMGNT